MQQYETVAGGGGAIAAGLSDCARVRGFAGSRVRGFAGSRVRGRPGGRAVALHGDIRGGERLL